jgi:uroporphyrinogen-III decarboxylase
MHTVVRCMPGTMRLSIRCLASLSVALQSVKATHPNVPLTLYANGSGGLLERLKSTGVDVVSAGDTLGQGARTEPALSTSPVCVAFSGGRASAPE